MAQTFVGGGGRGWDGNGAALQPRQGNPEPADTEWGSVKPSGFDLILLLPSPTLSHVSSSPLAAGSLLSLQCTDMEFKSFNPSSVTKHALCKPLHSSTRHLARAPLSSALQNKSLAMKESFSWSLVFITLSHGANE